MSDTEEIILKVIGWIVTPIISAILAWIIAKGKTIKTAQQKVERKQKALEETCKLTLRKSLQDDYEFYVLQQRWCSVEDKVDVEEEYQLYHEIFEGNGRGTRYYQAIMSLPDKAPEKN